MPTRVLELPSRRTKDSYATLPCATCSGKRMNLCRPLEGRLQVESFGLAIRQRWARREVMFRVGDTLGPVLKITKGIASVYRSLDGGRRQILRFLLPGDVCGYPTSSHIP
jgi:CRP-like cAMP-binding protein